MKPANDQWWEVYLPGQRNEYRGWQIEYNPPPIPWRGADWQATHPDYDGEGDSRAVQSDSLDGVQAAIDAWYEENPEKWEGPAYEYGVTWGPWPRDSDASLAEDAQRLSPEGVAARAAGIAQDGSPSISTPKAEA